MAGERAAAVLSRLEPRHLFPGAEPPRPPAPPGDSGQIEELRPENVLYTDPYHTVYKVAGRFRAAAREYRVIECGSRAGVVPVREGRILLVRQYRLLVNGLSWEIPGGRVEAGETPREAAVRECLEETGLLCRDLRGLTGYLPGMDVFCNPTYLYCSHDVREGRAAEPHPGETVEKAWFPVDRVLDMVQSMEIVDAFTMIAVLAYARGRDRSDPHGNPATGAQGRRDSWERR